MKNSTKDTLAAIALVIVVALSPYLLFLALDGMGCQFPVTQEKQLEYLGVDTGSQTYHWMDRNTGDCFSSDNLDGNDLSREACR